MPTIWWPGTSGSFACVSSPSTMCRSVRQTAQASTRRSSSPAAGSGTGSSARRSGSPGRSSTIARIVAQAIAAEEISGWRVRKPTSTCR
jgi:hypothetical protein